MINKFYEYRNRSTFSGGVLSPGFAVLVLIVLVMSCKVVESTGGLADQPEQSLSPTVVFLPLAAKSFNTYYVAVDGSDEYGTGSMSSPWATIGHAVTAVPDKSTILVKPGTYYGQIDLRRSFDEGITIQSETPYQARLRHNQTVITCFYCQGITLTGFDIAHTGPGADRYVIQIQDVRDDGTGGKRVTLRDNVLHDSYNNDILKINNGAHEILVEGNVFYNQAGLDEHIDLTSAFNVTIQDNIFFNDFAGSGRVNANDTAGFILIKDVDGAADGQVGSHNINVRRNVFLNWAGFDGDGFITLGDNSDDPYFHAYDILIENNLMLGNAGNVIHAAFKVVRSRDVIFRHNTVVGDLPSQSYAFRLTTRGLLNERIQFYNNIWADPTGTMGAAFPGDWTRFSRTSGTASFVLTNNLYWNGGEPIPYDDEEPINYSDDTQPLVANPLLPSNQQGIEVPRWQPGNGRFADGSVTIRQAFIHLVETYGRPGTGSPAINSANPTYSPTTDILGNPRLTPDIGAYER